MNTKKGAEGSLEDDGGTRLDILYTRLYVDGAVEVYVLRPSPCGRRRRLLRTKQRTIGPRHRHCNHTHSIRSASLTRKTVSPAITGLVGGAG